MNINTVCSFVAAILVIAYISSCNLNSKNEQGKFLYETYCGNCHMDNGEGLAKLYPPLNNSDYLFRNRDRLACQIRHGIEGLITVNGIEYDMVMPGNQNLTEVEINNILNYIFSAWDNNLPASNVQEVKAQLELCPKAYR